MDDTHSRRREDLVSRMLAADTEAESEAAEEAARAWLQEHPGDAAVAAAAERVAGRRESLEDQEVRSWRAARVPLAACVPPITIAIGVFGGWDVAWWAGPMLAVPVAYLVAGAFELVRLLRGHRAEPGPPPWSWRS